MIIRDLYREVVNKILLPYETCIEELTEEYDFYDNGNVKIDGVFWYDYFQVPEFYLDYLTEQYNYKVSVIMILQNFRKKNLFPMKMRDLDQIKDWLLLKDVIYEKLDKSMAEGCHDRFGNLHIRNSDWNYVENKRSNNKNPRVSSTAKLFR